MSKEKSHEKALSDSFIYWKTKPSNKVKIAFQDIFPTALNVKWRLLATGYYKVLFSLNDEKLFAIFTSEGEFVRIYKKSI
ncbi:hypothetical protein L3073_02520 [Ancylomarina sp. DW003]|nr:hypothetical protein [Ancylomarina sp. DW003]MDE5421075.1 hypothetical protein [Ancylomarina sp. DW003]